MTRAVLARDGDPALMDPDPQPAASAPAAAAAAAAPLPTTGGGGLPLLGGAAALAAREVIRLRERR